MENFDDIKQLAKALGDGSPHNPSTPFETVEELVDSLVALGRNEDIVSGHDDFLGLKRDLPKSFLSCRIEDLANNQEFQDEQERVLSEGKKIFRLVQQADLGEDTE